MSSLTAEQARRIAVAAQGFAEPPAGRGGDARAPAAAGLADPSAAAGFGVGRGAGPLCAGVQPARPLRPGGARPCGVESQRAVAAAARRVLGARGRADGRRRLAAAALADAGVRRTAGGAQRSSRRTQRLADDIVAAVAELGPSTAGQIEAHLGAEQRGRKGPWWDRSDTKWVTEALWSSGVLTTATRIGFARHYDLTERVLPPEVVASEVDDDEAVRELTLRAAGALGVGTEADIRDYFRLGRRAGQAGDRQAGRRRGAGARRGRRLDGAGLSARGPDRARGATAGRRCCARSTR